MPEEPPIPRCVRVLKKGVVIDQWLIAFPFTRPQRNWLIDMSYRWSPLDDSEENRDWILEFLDSIDAASGGARTERRPDTPRGKFQYGPTGNPPPCEKTGRAGKVERVEGIEAYIFHLRRTLILTFGDKSVTILV